MKISKIGRKPLALYHDTLCAATHSPLRNSVPDYYLHNDDRYPIQLI